MQEQVAGQPVAAASPWSTEQYGALRIERHASGKWARLYSGRATRPFANYMFQSAERMEAYIAECKQGADANAAMMAQRKADREKPHGYKVGDVLKYSWGWEQTNPEFYQVVGTTAHTVTLREIAQEQVDAVSDMAGHVMPVRDKFIGAPITKRADGHGSVKMPHGHASLWSGNKAYYSTYA
jgi:hypothetical protein